MDPKEMRTRLWWKAMNPGERIEILREEGPYGDKFLEFYEREAYAHTEFESLPDFIKNKLLQK